MNNKYNLYFIVNKCTFYHLNILNILYTCIAKVGEAVYFFFCILYVYVFSDPSKIHAIQQNRDDNDDKPNEYII